MQGYVINLYARALLRMFKLITRPQFQQTEHLAHEQQDAAHAMAMAVARHGHPAPSGPDDLQEYPEYRVVVESDWKFEAELEPAIDWGALGLSPPLCTVLLSHASMPCLCVLLPIASACMCDGPSFGLCLLPYAACTMLTYSAYWLQRSANVRRVRCGSRRNYRATHTKVTSQWR
jgi:hypothetical protein